eukprot:1141767-Pelagomonas_calceolata.AAC.2
MNEQCRGVSGLGGLQGPARCALLPGKRLISLQHCYHSFHVQKETQADFLPFFFACLTGLQARIYQQRPFPEPQDSLKGRNCHVCRKSVGCSTPKSPNRAWYHGTDVAVMTQRPSTPAGQAPDYAAAFAQLQQSDAEGIVEARQPEKTAHLLWNRDVLNMNQYEPRKYFC